MGWALGGGGLAENVGALVTGRCATGRTLRAGRGREASIRSQSRKNGNYLRNSCGTLPAAMQQSQNTDPESPVTPIKNRNFSQMSLFSHCDPTFTVECVCWVIAQAPVWATVGLFAVSLVIYDVAWFWLGVGLIANGLVNTALNLFIHPHNATQVVFGTAGFLGNPSFKAQFCVYFVVTLLIFYERFTFHVAGYVFGFLYFVIIAVLYASVYLTHEPYTSIYFGAGIGFIDAVVFMFVYYFYLERYSSAICHSWFGNLKGMYHCYSSRVNLLNAESHDKLEAVKRALGTDSIKEVLNFALQWSAVAHPQDSNPVYTIEGAEGEEMSAL